MKICLIGFMGLLFLMHFCPAQPKTLVFHVNGGLFAPQDHQIQGMECINYNANGSPAAMAASGIGSGADLRLGITYFTKYYGIGIHVGVRPLDNRKEELSLAPDGLHDKYENRLIMIPVTVNFIYAIQQIGSNVQPYLGVGAGIQMAQMEFKYNSQTTQTHTWMKGDEISPGIQFMAGLSLSLSDNVMALFEYSYSYFASDWEITDQDTDEMIKMIKLNTGGTSLTLGIAYRLDLR
jgi:opacity protein-like surface antigen